MIFTDMVLQNSLVRFLKERNNQNEMLRIDAFFVNNKLIIFARIVLLNVKTIN